MIFHACIYARDTSSIIVATLYKLFVFRCLNDRTKQRLHIFGIKTEITYEKHKTNYAIIYGYVCVSYLHLYPIFYDF